MRLGIIGISQIVEADAPLVLAHGSGYSRITENRRTVQLFLLGIEPGGECLGSSTGI